MNKKARLCGECGVALAKDEITLCEDCREVAKGYMNPDQALDSMDDFSEGDVL